MRPIKICATNPERFSSGTAAGRTPRGTRLTQRFELENGQENRGGDRGTDVTAKHSLLAVAVIFFCATWSFKHCSTRPRSRTSFMLASAWLLQCSAICDIINTPLHATFNRLFSRTTWLSRNTRKVKPNWILRKQEMMGWQWHQLDHMQIICTSLHIDNHASTSSLNFLQPGCSSWCPTNSVKTLKAIQQAANVNVIIKSCWNPQKPLLMTLLLLRLVVIKNFNC